MKTNILTLLVLFLFSCKFGLKEEKIYDIQKHVTNVPAGVASAHPLASQIGTDILEAGGNAIDAAIAVHFALAVCYPGAGNIGGGGFLLYREENGNVACLDFREKAPSGATKDMYLDSIGNPITEASLYGALAAGVPGSVDGMYEAFLKFSKLKNWEKLLQPAIGLAENGYRITVNEAEMLKKNQNKFKKNNVDKTVFQKDDWKPGDLLIQKSLGETLKRIQKNKKAGFYEGLTADLIVAEMKRSGGIITHEDLRNYHSVWRKPMVGNYRGHKVYSMPPPSSGGIALLQLLKMVEPYPLEKMEFHSPEHLHVVAEAERRVYADRAKHLGDPDFYNVPQENLLDSAYIVGRMKNFNPRKASLSDSIFPGIFEKEETTHFSIVDIEGNAVAVTTTLNGSYGAYTVVEGAGFLLNNEMDDFSVKPGTPNLYGLIGFEANKIEPGKRMLSSMTPTIIEKNGTLFMVVGTPGGSTIITSVFQLIINIIDFKKDLFSAVQTSRFHHQWQPDILYFEKDGVPEKTIKVLEMIGHHCKPRETIGRVEAILANTTSDFTIVADKRGDDHAAGCDPKKR
ncbi:MAG: gamma-glutamyltransferase [Saprospiraceae bacterium]|nr:gamma-glutamyltransferase [Saprospiraceae bacterium]MBK8370134.1 gamma-glutamyltransferase [Saprospiraceae bacterium]MBK8546855.1 gamma-glutamyltransferase [Saprospiraceae bacterium]MBK9042846.1 gamma-glutamyltransferase [Saprospiraceae bacterium]